MTNESIFITAVIAANKKRQARCYDITSAFINMDLDKDVLMVLKDELAEMMMQIVPQVYQKYVKVNKKGTKVLYVKLQKALYGLMRTSLLFYKKLRKKFEVYGLTLNPYDLCIANMMTCDRKQLPVI